MSVMAAVLLSITMQCTCILALEPMLPLLDPVRVRVQYLRTRFPCTACCCSSRRHKFIRVAKLWAFLLTGTSTPRHHDGGGGVVACCVRIS